MSKKYIDAEEAKAVLELVKMHREEDAVREEMLEMATKAVSFYIDNLPTVDAVEVVRCKDCKYNSRDVGGGVILCYCPNMTDDDGNPLAMFGEDFCSNGERRT